MQLDDLNRPQGLLHGGEHFEDVDEDMIGAGERSQPRAHLVHKLSQSGLHRPIENRR